MFINKEEQLGLIASNTEAIKNIMRCVILTLVVILSACSNIPKQTITDCDAFGNDAYQCKTKTFIAFAEGSRSVEMDINDCEKMGFEKLSTIHECKRLVSDIKTNRSQQAVANMVYGYQVGQHLQYMNNLNNYLIRH